MRRFGADRDREDHGGIHDSASRSDSARKMYKVQVLRPCHGGLAMAQRTQAKHRGRQLSSCSKLPTKGVRT